MRIAVQFAVGLALATILARSFLVMGLIVPVTVHGSSMAPALVGPHVAVTCLRCGEISRIGTDQLPTNGWVACPSCAALLKAGDLPVAAGDAIWIDRTAFELQGPRRFEVVVFQCPDDATAYCVKRVVGLPGEHVALRGGSVLINGIPVNAPDALNFQFRPGDGRGQVGFDPRQQCWQLGEGYFVVGDNDAVSLDSRNWAAGPDLPPKLLVGRPIGGGRSSAEPPRRSAP